MSEILKLSVAQLLLYGACIMLPAALAAQGSNLEYERLRIEDVEHIVVGIDLSPDQKHLAISGVQSYPCYIFDWESREIKNQFDVGNWYAGSSVRYSPGGRYLLLQQLFYIDLAPNKDREVMFEVIDAVSGEVVKVFDRIHAAAFTPDEKYIATLTAEEVSFWNLETGNRDKSFSVQQASNGIAISPDGNSIAVSHRPHADELRNRPDYKQKKKIYQEALKYKQQVSLFSLETFERTATVDEFYDVVYRLEYSGDGSTLFCLNIPHVKVQSGTGRQSYINTIDPFSGMAQRKGFTSLANYEPDFRLSHNGRMFGLVSQNRKFLELHIYDFETGRLDHRYELAYRLFEKNDGKMVAADSRASFVFLPGDGAVVITMGNHLVHWKIKQEE